MVDLDRWLGQTARARDGSRLGELDDVFTTGDGVPSFGLVEVGGQLGVNPRLVAVPLDAATHDGEDVVLPFAQRTVWDGPEIPTGTKELPPELQERIRRHYAGNETRAMPADTPRARPAQADARADEDIEDEDDEDEDEDDALGLDAPDDDDVAEVIVSEERLNVDKRAVPAARARLRKVVVEEEVTVTVTVRREELEVVREPLDEAAAAAIAPGSGDVELRAGELEFVLHAEEPVVTKRVVPVERVTVRKESVAEDLDITETLRRERVSVDDPSSIPREDQP